MPGTESKIPVGQILVGKYRVVREIGRGGMAAVFEAEQLSLGKKVAVKILAAELSASTIVIERFFREARAAASIRSPYIVDVYDSGRLDDGRPFITMELLEGESLYDRMARVRVIDVDTTIRVIIHTAKGLVKAHAAGIVHRDLKPENIFLTRGEDGDDICKILDFGLAKFYAPVNPEEKAQKRLTREGAVFGTPAYMSPEQVKGQGNVDHRADLWALGCMAYECLIGRPVWNMDQGVAMTFAAIAAGPIPTPSQIRPDLPPEFDYWFKRCLERDPDRRYQSAKELADAFVGAWGQRPTSSSASFPQVPLSPRIAPQSASIELEAELLENMDQGPPAAPSSRRPGLPPGYSSSRNVQGIHSTSRGPAAMMNQRVDESDASLPLVQRIGSVDGVPISQSDASLAQRKTSPVRVVLSALLLAGGVTSAIFVWLRFLSPQVFAPVVQSTASASAPPPPSGVSSSGPPPDEPKWAAPIADGQRLLSQGDLVGAKKKFQDAVDLGGPAAAIGKVYLEQSKIIEKPTGPCRTVMFARPRMSTDRRAERPSIAATSKGAVLAWSDDHEQDKRDHVYDVTLDVTGKSLSAVRDLTPEAAEATRPMLATLGQDRLVVLYVDEKGKEAGVRARLLDGDGRIDKNRGASVLIGAGRPGQFWPTIDRGSQGFHVVWQDDRKKDGEYDVFTRHISNDLDTLSPETRLTDYVAQRGKSTPRVRYPSVAVAANTMIVAYRLDQDRDKSIMRMRIPLDNLTKGLDEPREPSKATRLVGDVALVNEDRAPADAPAVACGPEGCFIVWHGETGGAYAAMIDPKQGKVIWRKKFADKGGHPSLGVNEGQVAVAFYEQGRLRMSILSGDGVGPPSTLLRMVDPLAPRPFLAPGAQKSEWYLAWQDADAPRSVPEIYAARVSCR